jgi:hypothetical protein
MSGELELVNSCSSRELELVNSSSSRELELGNSSFTQLSRAVELELSHAYPQDSKIDSLCFKHV